MFLAPMPSVLAARRAGTLGELNPLPFPSLIGNCVAWIAYGLVVKARPPTLFPRSTPPAHHSGRSRSRWQPLGLGRQSDLFFVYTN
jgi:hypothetical protein